MIDCRKGQIVRKTTSVAKIPVGPYLLVVKTAKPAMLVETFDSTAPRNLKDRKFIMSMHNAVLVKRETLPIDDKQLERIKAGKLLCVQNSAKYLSWKNLLRNPPEIIRFKARRGFGEVYVVVDSIREEISLNERIIRIIINRVI